MSGKLLGLRRRLAKAEKVLVEASKRERLAACICKRGPAGITVAWSAEMFEAEMNRTCQVHGFRRLGQLHIVQFVEMDRTCTEETIKLNQLVETYKLRLSQLPPDPDFEDDPRAA